MMTRCLSLAWLVALVACGGGEESSTGQISPPGSGGAGGSAGQAGSGGTSAGGSSGAGTGGSDAGSGGSGAAGGVAGAAGAGGSAGQGGAGGAGEGGSAGQGGSAGNGGASGGAGGGSGGTGGSTGGASGSGGVGGGGAAGEGGGGAAGAGGEPVCDVLVETGAPVTVTFGEGQLLSNLALERLTGGEVLIGVKTLPNESPGPVPPTLRFATLNALGPWPSGDVAPLKTSLDEAGSSYLLRGTGVGQTFEALSTRELGPGLVGPVARQEVGANFPATTIFDAPARVRAWARGEGWSLAAAELEPAPSVHRLLLARDVPGQPVEPLSSELACATAPLVADALWRGDRFLLGLSSSRKPFSCNDDDGIDGPPTQVQLFRQGEKAGDVEVTFDMDLKAPLRVVRLLPRGAGAWLVTGASQDGYSVPLRMIPVMEQGFPGAALVDLTGDALVPAQPSVASMSDERVAVAYVEEGGQVPHLRLRATTLSSSVAAEVGPFFASTTALVAPASDTLVVGWVENNGPGDRVRLARFRCEKAE